MKTRAARSALALGGVCVLFSGLAWGGEGMRGPGAASSARPPLQSRAAIAHLPRGEAGGVGAGLMLGLLGFYRNVVSTVDGDRCSMAPTCSLYSRQAVETHGALLGTLLTADRLLHEADEIPLVRAIEIGGETYYSDPLEANTYWWR